MSTKGVGSGIWKRKLQLVCRSIVYILSGRIGCKKEFKKGTDLFSLYKENKSVPFLFMPGFVWHQGSANH
jgi:hypothetical protein